MDTAIVLIRCEDRPGIVAGISGLLFEYGCNVFQADQYSMRSEHGLFFMRVEFSYSGGAEALERITQGLKQWAAVKGAELSVHPGDRRPRMGILVSRHDHCLEDLLYRWRSGELAADIPLVVSNHPELGEVVRRYGIAFHHIPVARDCREEAEAAILGLVRESTDFLVLARYMQILSPGFLHEYGREVINIHHSFLPSFKGADPYRQAWERGVKIIGATAHYVTGDLDEGPIIEQTVTPVSHRDDVEALKRKGRNLEKLALANAVRAHLEHRVIRFDNRTIVFA